MRILLARKNLSSDRDPERLLRKALHAVDLIQEPDEALEAAEVNSYDVIIASTRLREFDAARWCRSARERKIETPILLLTTAGAVDEKIAALDNGADDCLAEPFSPEEFLARVRALARRKERRATNRLEIGDLVLDPAAHMVYRDGRAIELTALEFKILECLMAANGAVLSREAIMEKVWDMNFETESNVVDVYINYLRKKIDFGAENPLIHTIRGVGYLMKTDARALKDRVRK
jgi:DNA-binding response OmpR family regulator